MAASSTVMPKPGSAGMGVFPSELKKTFSLTKSSSKTIVEYEPSMYFMSGQVTAKFRPARDSMPVYSRICYAFPHIINYYIQMFVLCFCDR